MIFLIIAITVLANLADIFLKIGASQAGTQYSDPLVLVQIPWIWLGAALGVAAMILWIFILSRQHLSYAYPIVVGLSFINISLVSTIYLGEEISIRRLLGIVLVAAGIFVIHFLSARDAAQTPPAPKIVSRQARPNV